LHDNSSIPAADVAMLLETAGLDYIVSIDLHCDQIKGFFHEIPVVNLMSSGIFVPYLSTLRLNNPVIVSPDAAGVGRAERFRDLLAQFGCKASFALVVNKYDDQGSWKSTDLVGEVAGCDVIVVDDMVDTGETLCRATSELKKFGAKRVFACVVHPIFSGAALQNVVSSECTEVVVSNSIPLEGNISDKIKQLSISGLLSGTVNNLQGTIKE
jgi:ribose-phosphate pyrophosphokinase